jgi:dipeptidyl aminopeptidase/acylaminoacyl peptidase
VSFPAGQVVGELRCDRAGRRVVYSVAPEGGLLPTMHEDLWMLDLDGGGPPRRLTAGHQDGPPIFHPDGASIIFASRRGGAAGLWEISTAGGAPVPLLTGSGTALPGDVSPDGRTLYFQDDVTTTQIFAHTRDGGASRRVIHPMEQLLRIKALPADRGLAAIVVRDGQRYLVRVPLDGSEEHTLGPAEAAALSLDRRELYFAVSEDGGSRLRAMPLDGGPAREVARLDGRVVALREAPGGQLDVSIERASGISAWRVPTAGGAATDAGLAGWNFVSSAPGGWRLAQRIAPNRNQAPLEAHVVAPGRPLDDPAAPVLSAAVTTWEPDGRALLYWSGEDVRRRIVDTGEEQVLFPQRLALDLTVSLDGKIIYTVDVVGRVRRRAIVNFADRQRPRP